MKHRMLVVCTFITFNLLLSACDIIMDAINPSSAPVQEFVQEPQQLPPDTDYDNIPDGIEDWVAQTHAPYLIHDEQELAEQVRYVYQVVPVLLNDQPRVLFIVVALYDLDWAEASEMLDADLKWHYGDAESIRFYLTYDLNYPGDPYHAFEGNYRIAEVVIRRHGHAYDYYVDDFQYRDGSHPVLWVSEGKHAMFSSADDCEGNSFMTGFDEDCGEGPEWYASLPFSMNVGELNNPYFQYIDERSELSVFPGERIWDRDYPFCGGYDLGDDRWQYWDVPGFGDLPTCAGPIGDKFFPWP